MLKSATSLPTKRGGLNNELQALIEARRLLNGAIAGFNRRQRAIVRLLDEAETLTRGLTAATIETMADRLSEHIVELTVRNERGKR